jgi:ATP-dependent Clp protease ATP-binding subunit ClpA
VATLHVRNVPDELYEELRAAAEADGRSIGAEAIALLRLALPQREERRRELGRVLPSPPSFKAQFAARAKQIVLHAQALAQRDGADEVTPAHVMLAMLDDPVLRPSLERGGVTEAAARAALPPPAKPRSAPPPVGDDARKMLERAMLAALDLDA